MVKPEGILASNTSSISITRIAAVTQRPEQVVQGLMLPALFLGNQSAIMFHLCVLWTHTWCMYMRAWQGMKPVSQ